MQRTTNRLLTQASKCGTVRKQFAQKRFKSARDAVSRQVADDEAAESTPEKNKVGEKPFRHALAWQDPKFYDEESLEQEMRRVFDICHGTC